MQLATQRLAAEAPRNQRMLVRAEGVFGGAGRDGEAIVALAIIGRIGNPRRRLGGAIEFDGRRSGARSMRAGDDPGATGAIEAGARRPAVAGTR